MGPPPPLPPSPPPEDVRLVEVDDGESKYAYSAEVATAAVSKVAAAATSQSAVKVDQGTVLPTIPPHFVGKTKKEVAAIRIQTAFRGYLAKRALRALRGLIRLKSLMEGSVVKRQAATTLRCMQTLSRVQSQIQSRRIRMSEENQALQRQLLQKHAKELVNLRIGEEWDDSTQSKEQIEANLLSKHEASMRRERSLAYSFSHQKTWKNSSKCVNPMFMDPTNPSWGWSWLERWMAARPWETRSAIDKELNNDQVSMKSTNRSIVGGEISKSYLRHQLNSDKQSPTASYKPSPKANLQSPSTPSKPGSSTVTRKLKLASPRESLGPDDDSKSMISVQSDRFRRHSIAGSSVRDDESLVSSPAVPSYMVPTESARAKTKLQTPLGIDKIGTPEKGSVGSAKKRLSYPPSPARPRRHSGHPKVEGRVNAEIVVTNGGGS
ncbi:protein IQ-DOMAIN 1-like isoform X2 [Carica papaya]|nr:protein IQ-DOMAIN 1-like isoform X2 [Carica papaya]